MFLSLLDYFGTIVFALSGVLLAERKEMDFFGGLVLATAASIGGGTLRDMILGANVFWIIHSTYLTLVLSTCVVSFVFVRFLNSVRLKWIEIADAIGLATFTVIGSMKAYEVGLGSGIVIVMGIMTGVAGGMIRDILAGQSPLILSSRHFYATSSFLGALSLVLFLPVVETNKAIIVAFAVTLILRLAAIRWNLKLPLFSSKQEGKSS